MHLRSLNVRFFFSLVSWCGVFGFPPPFLPTSFLCLFLSFEGHQWRCGRIPNQSGLGSLTCQSNGHYKR
jgi:hypothetical protein